MRIPTQRQLATLITIALVVGSCGSTEPSLSKSSDEHATTASPEALPTAEPLSTPEPSLIISIPPTGTTMAVPGGPTVKIPAGAVDAQVSGSITVGPAVSPTKEWPARTVGKTWVIRAGDVPLAKPVLLTIPYDETSLAQAVDPSSLLLAYQDQETGSWVPVEATVDSAAHTVNATVDHLSHWGVFTIDWDYWLAFIKDAASGNLGDLLDGVATLTSKCSTKESGYQVDNGGTNGMVKACITATNKSSARVRVTNLRTFGLKLFGDSLEAANGTILGPGKSATLSVGGKTAQPVIVSADLDALALGYDITDIVLRLLPDSTLARDSDTYIKILGKIAKAQEKIWTGTQFLDEMKAGDVLAAASSATDLLTSETYLTTLFEALQVAGREDGIPVLSALTKDGIKRVLTVVNLTDLIVTTFTFVTQYFISAHSEVHLTWVNPPGTPTKVAARITCEVGYDCPEKTIPVQVSWHAPSGPISGYHVYYTPGTEDLCANKWTATGPRHLVSTVPAGRHSWTGSLVEKDSWGRYSVAAFNDAGQSAARSTDFVAYLDLFVCEP